MCDFCPTCALAEQWSEHRALFYFSYIYISDDESHPVTSRQHGDRSIQSLGIFQSPKTVIQHQAALYKHTV